MSLPSRVLSGLSGPRRPAVAENYGERGRDRRGYGRDVVGTEMQWQWQGSHLGDDR